MAISEAMAAGLPVLATHHGGIPEIVDDEVTGLLVAERDVDALAEAMSRIARDHNLVRRMARAGRQKIGRDLNLDRWNDVLAKRIQTLVGPQKAKGSTRSPRNPLASVLAFSRVSAFIRIRPQRPAPIRLRKRIR